MPDALSELSSWIQRLPRARVALLGDLVLDEYLLGVTDRISREAPVPVVRETRREQVLGGAANAVAGVLALGATCRPLGVVGKDAAGDRIVALLRERGADVTGIVRVPGRPTETKTRVLAGGLSTTPQQVVRVDRGANGAPLPAEAIADLRRVLKASLAESDVLVVSDYGLGVMAPRLLADVRRAGRRKPLLVDSRYDLRAYAGAALVKPNVPEIEAATGLRVDDAASAARAARKLAQDVGAGAVLVTRGHQGMTLQPRRGPPLHLPVFGPPEAVDVTGAGDAVMATFAVALAAGASEADAARLANVAGGIVVQKPGTATITLQELAAALSQAGEDGRSS